MYKKTKIDFNLKESPFFNFTTTRHSITFNANTKKTYEYCKKENLSFFNISLAILLEGLNKVPELKWRIINNEVFEFEKIDAITPILQEDNSIREIKVQPITEYKNPEKWHEHLNTMKNNIQEYEFKIDTMERDTAPIANFSCIPWIKFTSLTNMIAEPHQIQPLITWGKYEDNEIPISLTANHIFVYGYHFKLFNDSISHYFNNPLELI